MKMSIILRFLLITTTILALTSCGMYKKVDQRQMPDGAAAKARKALVP